MKQGEEHINQHLSEFLDFSARLTEKEKELQAAAMVGLTKEVDVDQALKKVLARTAKQKKTFQLFQQLIKVAAVLAIPLLVYTSWSVYKQLSVKQEMEQFAEQEFVSPVGMRSYVILPDGTKVWLNAESKLRYTVPFIRENRNIQIEGEAFLNVAHNKKSPFILETANTTIEVTGTSFNVKAYPEDEYVSVALQEGSVKLSANNGTENKTAEMKAGDFFMVEKGTSNIKSVPTSIEKQIAWHNNILVLDETPMEEVASLLERWYGVKVFIADDELKKYKFSTTFENEPLNRVLELLELSSPGIKITYKPGKLNKNPGEKNYSVVTISKK